MSVKRADGFDFNSNKQFQTSFAKLTRCSAIAERPRCRVH